MSEPVRMADLAALHAPLQSDLEAAFSRVLQSGRFIGGPEVENFELAIAQNCGARFAVACNSGSDALLLALQSLKVVAGDDVLVPAYGFFATASAVARLGARPVFVDLDPRTYHLDPADAAQAIESCRRPRALIAVSLFGRAVELSALTSLTGPRGIALIDDAAQALGAQDSSGRRAGAGADAGCFSFYPTKNLGALGDAGALVFDDPEPAEVAARLRDHGVAGPYQHVALGMNSRLDAIQAAFLHRKLPALEAWTKARRENAGFYDSAFRSAGADLAGSAWRDAALPLALPAPTPPPGLHVQHHYVVRVAAERRDALRARLLEQGIESAVYYPLGLHEQPALAQGEARSLPETESAARETLALPIHPTLSRDALSRVVEAVVNFFQPSRA